MPTIDIYDKISLSEAVNSLVTPEPLVCNLIFKNRKFHFADKVELDLLTDSKGIAQFVSTSSTTPKQVAHMTKVIKTITIPRTWEEKLFTATQLAELKQAGDIYVNDERAREDAVNQEVAKELKTLKDRVTRLREKLAIEALSTGKITVDQNDLAFELDFGFVAGTHTITLTGNDLWTSSTADITGKVDELTLDIQQNCGLAADVCLLGKKAARYFKTNANIRKELNATNYQLGQLRLNQKGTIGGRYIGNIGAIDYYEITQQYGTSKTSMLGDWLAVYVASQHDGLRMHLAPAYRTQKNGLDIIGGEFLIEVVQDEQRRQFLAWDIEQKSIPAIHDPNAVIVVTVGSE